MAVLSCAFLAVRSLIFSIKKHKRIKRTTLIRTTPTMGGTGVRFFPLVFEMTAIMLKSDIEIEYQCFE